MSERPEITRILSKSIQKHICPGNDQRIYWAREVTFDYYTENAVRVDFMRFKPLNNTVSGIEKGDFYCYEVKSSVEDFHSKNGHNFLGDYNYYVMPIEVYEQVKKEIPYHVLKAIWLNYGRVGQPARPFLTKAVNNAHQKVMEKMQQTYDQLTGGRHGSE